MSYECGVAVDDRVVSATSCGGLRTFMQRNLVFGKILWDFDDIYASSPNLAGCVGTADIPSKP